MIPRATLHAVARAHLQDAEVLYNAGRYDGAAYLCGYAIEIKLKARICRALNWQGFPSNRKEFENFTSFRTHDLPTLRKLSGLESKLAQQHLADWSLVQDWRPETRYDPVGGVTQTKARDMLDAARRLLRVIK